MLKPVTIKRKKVNLKVRGDLDANADFLQIINQYSNIMAIIKEKSKEEQE